MMPSSPASANARNCYSQNWFLKPFSTGASLSTTLGGLVRQSHSYDVILHRFGKRTELPLVEDVARALCSKAVSTMRQPGRFQEGLAYIVEFYKRFGSHRGPVFDKLSAITRELIDDLSRSRGTSKPNTIETKPARFCFPRCRAPRAESQLPVPPGQEASAQRAFWRRPDHQGKAHVCPPYQRPLSRHGKIPDFQVWRRVFRQPRVQLRLRAPLSNGKNGNFVPLAGYHLLDCLFHARIGSFLPGRYQDSWGFDELSGPALDAQVAQHARDVLRVLDDTSKKWRIRRRSWRCFRRIC